MSIAYQPDTCIFSGQGKRRALPKNRCSFGLAHQSEAEETHGQIYCIITWGKPPICV
jgi:hypothetical protein